MASVAPPATPPVIRSNLTFPMTYSTAFSQWWASSQSSAIDAQKAVLSFLPFFPDKDGERTAKVNLVRLSGKNRIINELEITRNDEPVERTLVMLHGYGAGLGLFYRFLSRRED
jgi:cardiolipin-specific phospholipase